MTSCRKWYVLPPSKAKREYQEEVVEVINILLTDVSGLLTDETSFPTLQLKDLSLLADEKRVPELAGIVTTLNGMYMKTRKDLISFLEANCNNFSTSHVHHVYNTCRCAINILDDFLNYVQWRDEVFGYDYAGMVGMSQDSYSDARKDALDESICRESMCCSRIETAELVFRIASGGMQKHWEATIPTFTNSKKK